MAAIIEEPTHWGSLRRSKYDWDHWLDGQTWELTKGKDYTAASGAVKIAARTAGRQRGLDVKVKVSTDGDSIVLKAVPAQAAEPASAAEPVTE